MSDLMLDLLPPDCCQVESVSAKTDLYFTIQWFYCSGTFLLTAPMGARGLS